MTLKEFINAMQVGWNDVPKNSVCLSYVGHPNSPQSCCPMIHAYYGITGRATYLGNRRVEEVLPFAFFSQKVHHDGEDVSLANAIVYLADVHHWTTPKIIAWLKTHL